MSLDTVEKIAAEVFASPLVAPPISFLWHEGEPLTAGKAFFERAFSIVNDIGAGSYKSFNHSIQSNGMLLDDGWIDLFEKFEVHLGLSVDGPKFLHDASRKTYNGRGTFDVVMKKVELLKKRKYRFGAICVLTPAHLAHADAIFHFFRNMGLDHIAFNVEETEGANKNSSLNAVSPNDVKLFYRRLLQLEEEYGGELSIREFEYLRRVRNNEVSPNVLRRGLQSDTSTPFRIFTFDSDGNVITFSPELLGMNSPYGKFLMGNIHTRPLDAILENEIFRKAWQDIKLGLHRCQTECSYWSLCGGGPPSNKLSEHGTFNASETMCCRLHRQTVIDAFCEEYEKQT